MVKAAGEEEEAEEGDAGVTVDAEVMGAATANNSISNITTPNRVRRERPRGEINTKPRQPKEEQGNSGLYTPISKHTLRTTYFVGVVGMM